MKIAIVGKGGSGKSTVSWLIANYLVSQGRKTLAIDADHNQDLTSNLGYIVDENTPTIHHSHQQFRDFVGLKAGDKMGKLVLDGEFLSPKFSYNPKQNQTDQYTKSLLLKIQPNLDLVVGGLGADDTLFSDKCSHGQLSPLKFYLPFLELNGNDLIIDSVAGTDMINYGLYLSCDAIVCVVEMHTNSIKVFEQIKSVGNLAGIKVLAILNKISSQDLPQMQKDLYTNFVSQNKELILGQIPADHGILSYNYDNVGQDAKDVLKDIVEQIDNLPVVDGIEALKNFEIQKQKINQS